MKRLWVHEILRVFGDRLIDDVDTSWLVEQIRVTVKEHMDTTMEELLEDLLPSVPTGGVASSKNVSEFATYNLQVSDLALTRWVSHRQLPRITERELRNLVFCDFGDTKGDVQLYQQVSDLEQLRETVEAYLAEYNSMSRKPMDLVLFR